MIVLINASIAVPYSCTVFAHETTTASEKISTTTTATTATTATTVEPSTTKKKTIKKKTTKKKTVSKKKSSEKKENKKKKEKSKGTEKIEQIPMPKRAVKVKGCDSVQKRINNLKKRKKKLQHKIQQESKKKEALKEFYADLDKTYGINVALLGKEIDINTELEDDDLTFRARLIHLADVFRDDELREIANHYVFGLRTDCDFTSILEKEKMIDLSDYLSRKNYQKTEIMEKEIKEIHQKIKEEKKTRFFDPKNVSSVSNITVADAKKMLSGTALYSEAAAFVKAERLYHVNAVFLMGIAAHESAWGTSRRAREDNNLTGYGVYSDSAKGINKPSKEAGLLATAETLHERYLTPGGSYYEGTSVANVNQHYCVGNEWAGMVTNYGYQLMKKLEN